MKILKGYKMSFFTKLLLPFAIKLIASVARKITPEIRKELGDFVMKNDKKARETPNKWDDIFWDSVRSILGI